jgi:hypothetical protein
MKAPLMIASIVALLLIGSMVVPAITDSALGGKITSPAKRGASIELTLASSEPQVGSNVCLSGVLSKTTTVNNVKIALSILLPDGTVATPTQGSVTYTSRTGSFNIDYVPIMGGQHEFRASLVSSQYNMTATKSVVVQASDAPVSGDPLGVLREATNIELNLASSSIDVGKTMHAAGLLKAIDVLTGANVNLKVTQPDGATAYPALGPSTVTDGRGTFGTDYVPTMPGTYVITATFAGTDQYEGSSVNASFTALNPEAAAPAEYKYLVTSVGGTYHAKDAAGATVASGSNAATVINAALNALTPGRTIKETVRLQGDFTLSSSIIMRSNAVLDATGATISGSVNTNFVSGSGLTNFEIVGGSWDASCMTGGGTRVVSISSSTNGLVRGLVAHDHYYDCIDVSQSTFITVSHVDVGRVGHTAVVFGECSNCTLENSHLYDCAGGGCYILLEEGIVNGVSSNNIMRNNTVERTYLSGLSLCSLRDATDQGTNNLAECNIIIDCGLDGYHPGIACGWGDNKAAYNIIRYNTIYETRAYWPPAGNATQCGLGMACSDSHIYGNVIYDTYDAGILVMGDRNIVRDNRISGIQTYDYASILVEGSGNEIVGNSITDCPVGIRLAASSGSSNNHITNNHFLNMKNYIVMVMDAGSSGNVIENNIYLGTGSIYDRGTSTVVRNNTPAS